jgi:acylphosphatase
MEEEEKTQLRAIVKGVVQGVGYRMFASRIARNYQLSGYVKNLRDGSVEVLSIGRMDTQQLLIDQLRTGPSGARVDDVSVNWEAPSEEYEGFGVRF